MSNAPAVLVSWVAVNNDPYERNRDRSYRTNVAGDFVLGPTLTVLTEPSSPWRGKVDTVVLLRRWSPTGDSAKEDEAVDALVAALRERLPGLKVDQRKWPGTNPTDHSEIYEFLRREMPAIRAKYAGRELVVHISPGTASMHTVWVLMVETGMIPDPVRLIQSYRAEDRRPGQPCVADVRVGVESFYHAWKASHPEDMLAGADSVAWDPRQFRTDRLRAVWKEAQRYARVAVPVLILGERGTGKTTLANWIRANSPFRKKELDGNWPAVACGQYSPELMRAELFGYEKGAFTGATHRQEGLLARANGDTLFLDEVGDISRDLQRLLIKAVEEGRFQPIGAPALATSMFRLLTATNLAEGKLTERIDLDFLDRIGPLRLRIPPLREIPEELEWLWASAWQQAIARGRVARRGPRLNAKTQQAIVAALRRDPLHGNVRDLLLVAYRLLAHLSDPEAEPDAEVDFALEGLRRQSDPSAHPGQVERIAAAWARGASIAAELSPGSPLKVEPIFGSLRAYLADQIRGAATADRCSVADICDVPERTLRSWRGGAGSVGKK